MAQITLDIKKVVVVETPHGMDTICIHVNDCPTPFPELKYPPVFEVRARKGFGRWWCEDVLKVKPEIVK